MGLGQPAFLEHCCPQPQSGLAAPLWEGSDTSRGCVGETGVFRSRWSPASIVWAPTPTQALTAPIKAARVTLILGSDKDLLPQAHEAAAVSLFRQVNGAPCITHSGVLWSGSPAPLRPLAPILQGVPAPAACELIPKADRRQRRQTGSPSGGRWAHSTDVCDRRLQ